MKKFLKFTSKDIAKIKVLIEAQCHGTLVLHLHSKEGEAVARFHAMLGPCAHLYEELQYSESYLQRRKHIEYNLIDDSIRSCLCIGSAPS